MDKNTRMPIGDLSGSETELGVPTAQMIEQRAQDIARLDNRDPERFTDADWDKAQAELSGVPLEKPGFDTQDGAGMPGNTDGEVQRMLPKDEELLDQRLAERGVQEAAHDQRIAAADRETRQEG